MWRPEGWKNIYENVYAVIEQKQAEYKNGKLRLKAEREEAAFELGADAMLEALKRYGSRVDVDNFPPNCYVTHLVIIPSQGYTVFIPDEES